MSDINDRQRAAFVWVSAAIGEVVGSEFMKAAVAFNQVDVASEEFDATVVAWGDDDDEGGKLVKEKGEALINAYRVAASFCSNPRAE